MNPEAPFDDLPKWPPEPENDQFAFRVAGMVVALIIVILLLSISIMAFGAQAHDATSGWTYPTQCCSPDDTAQLCHPVECDEIGEDTVGNYTWQGLKFSRQQVFPTQDHQCHACNSWASTDAGKRKPDRPYCLFVRSSS